MHTDTGCIFICFETLLKEVAKRIYADSTIIEFLLNCYDVKDITDTVSAKLDH